MKVHQSGKGLPAASHRLDFLIIRPVPEIKQFLQVGLRAHIIAGEDIETP